MGRDTSSFDGVKLSELQGIGVKQGEREKFPDNGGTQLQVSSMNLNHDTIMQQSKHNTLYPFLFI